LVVYSLVAKQEKLRDFADHLIFLFPNPHSAIYFSLVSAVFRIFFFSQGQLVCSWKSGNMISILWSHRKLVLILTLNMELPYSSKSKMRARSGSGVRLDYFNRLVYKTILKYQVKPPLFLLYYLLKYGNKG